MVVTISKNSAEMDEIDKTILIGLKSAVSFQD